MCVCFSSDKFHRSAVVLFESTENWESNEILTRGIFTVDSAGIELFAVWCCSDTAEGLRDAPSSVPLHLLITMPIAGVVVLTEVEVRFRDI